MLRDTSGKRALPSSTVVATGSARVRLTISALLAGAVFALALVSPALAAKPRAVSDHYTVDGLTIPGVETGFIVKPGLPVTVTATGGVCPFGTGDFCPGPEGYAFDTTSSSFGGFTLPGAPAWGLVGRVADGPWTQIGSGPTTLTGSGALVFAINDDLLSDNIGSFAATVTYTCYPGYGYGDKNHYHCGRP